MEGAYTDTEAGMTFEQCGSMPTEAQARSILALWFLGIVPKFTHHTIDYFYACDDFPVWVYELPSTTPSIGVVRGVTANGLVKICWENNTSYMHPNFMQAQRPYFIAARN